MSVWEEGDVEDWQELPDDDVDHCQRCGGAIADGECAYITVDFGPGDVHGWTWCDECTDAFTAWRLGPDVTIEDPNLDADSGFARR